MLIDYLLSVLIGMTISGFIGLFLGSMVERSGWGFVLGCVAGPLGWIIVFLLPTKESPTLGDPQNSNPLHLTKPPQRDMESDEYKVWLGKTYSISENELFKKYECQGQLFETLEEALTFADEMEQKKVSLRKISNNLNDQTDEYPVIWLAVTGMFFVAVVALFLS